MRKAVDKKIGALRTLTIEGTSRGPCIVLFHGYGADAADLLPLSEMMGLSEDATWVFPEAPMDSISSPGMYGKAWFQIDVQRLEKAMVKGEPTDLSNTSPAGLEHARQCATSLYDELQKKHRSIIIGGFSQGAMVATELALTHDVKPGGLVIMSGALICKDRWLKMAPSCSGLPFIQTHGKNDVLLGYEHAENLYVILKRAGLDGEFIGFNGGHEIPPKVITKIGEFISGL